jgi:hypothetical protein
MAAISMLGLPGLAVLPVRWIGWCQLVAGRHRGTFCWLRPKSLKRDIVVAPVAPPG